MPLLAGAALAACAHRPPSAPMPASSEAVRHRAALATLLVRNDTDRRLRIGYRLAAAPGGLVVVGRVPARDSAHMAPVPAGEPLLLRAIDPDAHVLTLPPRTFDVDEVWTWEIPADAEFAGRGAER